MIKELFLQVKNTEEFEKLLENGEVSNLTIAFLEDTNQIWTLDKFYHCDNILDSRGLIRMDLFPTITVPVDLSHQDIHGNHTETQNTANCYVVKKVGSYMFPIVYGNAIKNGKPNKAAYTNLALNEGMTDFVNAYGNPISSPYIDKDLGLNLEDLECLYSFSDTKDLDGRGILGIEEAILFVTGYIVFSIEYMPPEGGNIILSLVNKNDNKVVWSWHIWLFPGDLTPVTITNASGVKYDIMPVCLATTYDFKDNTKCKNWFYQWGRSIPLLGPISYNSNEDMDIRDGVMEFHTYGGATTYQDGITNPTTYWYRTAKPLNWYQSESYYNLWDAGCSEPGSSDHKVIKTVYDPSPVGFTVPNGLVFSGFTSDAVIGSFSNGYTFKKNEEDTTGVFFPASGARAAEGLIFVGTLGMFYTTDSKDRTTKWGFGIKSGLVNMDGNSARTACSICCVKEK